MKSIFKFLPTASLAIGLASGVWAQPTGQTNYDWSAGGDKATWSQGANWVQGAPPPANGTTYQIDLGDFSTDSATPIELGPSNVVACNDSCFGPMWGQTLDIYGTLNCGFGMFAWGTIGSPTTTVNVHTNAYFSCVNTFAVGTAWWFPGGPNVVVNVYSNAFVGIEWMQFGGKLNLYGGTVSVTNGFNTGTATTPVFSGGLDTDATRAINLTYGSRLILPLGYTATVDDWINRGILQVYSVPNDTNDIVIEDGTDPTWTTNTVVYTTATSARPTAIRIEVPRTALHVGGLEQVTVVADYPSTTNVDVTTSPNVSITYFSSATGVATISTTGLVRATGAGNATLWAIVGTLSNSVAVSVAVYTNQASLIHRYSFSESASSTMAADSVGGANWAGTLNGTAAFSGSGQLELDGTYGCFLELPAGIITNMDAVSIETWASFETISNWACLWAFGDSDGTYGHNYITCQPHTGVTPPTAQTGIKNLNSEENPWFYPVLDNYSNVQIVAVYHPEAGYCSIYTNGVLAAINSSITILLTDATSTGDPYNYIGHSLYVADPYLLVSMDEFRIYRGPLTAGQIQADAALGPNQLRGTSPTATLTATGSIANLQLQWSTNSALVNLMSSPTLGAGANWSPVNTPLTIVGGNYQAIVPTSAGSQFFRLQQ
jgi:hypothetical protein